MFRLISIVACCIIGIAISLHVFSKKETKREEENESEENPEYIAVSEININAALPFSNVLTNYTNTGIGTQAGAINCLVVSSADSNLVLAGSQNGGIWRSTNAAHTWQPINDTARTLCVTSLVQNSFRPNEFYYSTGVNISVNGSLLFDIYHSTDNGQTFSVVHPTGTSFGRIVKILASALDSNTLYVLHTNSILSGPSSVYRTTDNCNSFQLVYQTSSFIDDMILLPNGTLELGFSHSVWRSTTGNLGTFVQATGMNASGYDTHLAFCQSQPNIQYCFVFIFGSYDFYKSIDSGQTWSFISNLGSMMFGRRLAVKPDDPDFVVTGNMGPSASTDGGLTWQYITAGHDVRSFNFDPHRSGKMYVTSDFGIATIEVDPMTPLSFNMEYRHDSTLYSQEEYHGDHGGTGIQSLQGYQDLGCYFIQSMTLSKEIMPGDGAYACVSKQNPTVGYFSEHDADLYRMSNLTTNPTFTPILNQLDTNNNGLVDDETMFIHPFVMNNANDSQLYIPTFHWLWRSTDRGNNWTKVSHQTGNKYSGVSLACTHKPNPIVYWTNSDSVFVFANAATAAPLTEFGRPVPFDPRRCFADPDHDSALYILNNTATSEIRYCANLFNPTSTWATIPVTQLTGVTIQCMALYPGNDQIILAGSYEGGLYVTLNRGLTWTKEGNMPNVQITEIKIRPSDKKVFIFTYGRGTWVADFAPPLSVSTPTSKTSNASAYPNPFRDHFTIDFDKELDAIVELTDMRGKQCLKKSVSGKQIKIRTEDLTPGFYLITVSSGNKIIYQAKGIRAAK